MFRRSVLQFSSRNQLAATLSRRSGCEQAPPLSRFSRRNFYSSFPEKSSHQNDATAGSSSGMAKVFLGSAIVGGGVLLAYQSGYMNQFLLRKHQVPDRTENIDASNKSFNEIRSPKVDDVEQVVKSNEVSSDIPPVETEEKLVSQSSDFEAPANLEAKDLSPTKEEERPYKIEESALNSQPESFKTITEHKDDAQETESDDVSDHDHPKMLESHLPATTDNSPYPFKESREAADLFDAYLLKDDADERSESIAEEQAPVRNVESVNDNATVDGKLIIDFLQAIHEAENRQAKIDALAFAEEKRALKDKYEKELRDLRARELMRTEEVAILEKEIARERLKAVSALSSLHEKMKEKLKTELDQKENESATKLKSAQELAKAELLAAIAREKAAHIEDMAEANLNINALCMAFYARSEENRQIHSVHKLALGALAVEEALNKGMPIQKELQTMNAYVESIEDDSLLHWVFSTLPEDVRHEGSDTLFQLHQKFNALKGSLRRNSLIPPGGGGVLACSLAQLASSLRMKKVDPDGDGIESTICKVEGFLAEGRIVDAADALQEGVRGSRAEEIVVDWLTRARNRAISEQALTVLQSYAIAISLAH